MYAVYHANIDELSASFIAHLKKQFKNARVEIVIKEMDETDYLNSSEKNRAYLEEAIEEVNNANLIHKTPEELGL